MALFRHLKLPLIGAALALLPQATLGATASEAWCAPAQVLSPLTRTAAATSSNEGDARFLTMAPAVPLPSGRTHATNILITIETREVVLPLTDSTSYTFWTFGGTVPGPFVRVREGDTVTLQITNAPDSTVAHSIDLHAVTGPSGGAARTQTAAGQSTEFRFKALRSGLYVYHCATAPVPVHLANGMYGLILVEPPGGLAPVDREYYVMQSEFYTSTTPGQPELLSFDIRKASDGKPTHVVFNGGIGVLAGDQSLRAKVGETVRLFVGNGGPNLISSFHVIGEIFDRVHQEGGSLVTQRNVQTTMIPPGGAAIVEFSLEVPGTYLLVDHSMFLGMNKGAVGQLIVDGPVLDGTTVAPTTLSSDGGNVTLRVRQFGEVIDAVAQITFPDQTHSIIPMTCKPGEGVWEAVAALPPNGGSAAVTYTLQWIATDAFGQSSRSDPRVITVESAASAPLRILSLTPESGGYLILWTATANSEYQVQSASKLTPADWHDVGDSITGTRGTASQFIVKEGTKQRFFRVVRLVR